MEWATAIKAAFDASGKVYVALKSVERQTVAEPCKARQATVQIAQLESTLGAIRKDCESAHSQPNGSSVKILDLRRPFGKLKDFLSESIKVPKWLIGVALQPPASGSAIESEKFLISLEQIKRATLTTLDQWHGDKRELNLPDMFAFLESFLLQDAPSFSTSPKFPWQAALRDQRTGGALKRSAKAKLNRQKPPNKKQCNNKSIAQLTAEPFAITAREPRGPRTRSMTARLSWEPSGHLDATNGWPTPPDSHDGDCPLRDDGLRQDTSYQEANAEEKPKCVRSKTSNEINERYDRLLKQQDQLLEDIDKLEYEMENGLLSFESPGRISVALDE